MQAADIPALTRLKEAAGWNQTGHDWTNVIALEPEGCWVEEEQGKVVGSTTAVCYERELAWIGMVLVLPSWRGRGLARGLMEHALRWLEERRVRQVKLDATDMGRPLYEKLGFREERVVERWGTTSAGGGQNGGELDAAKIAALDRESFGVDRRRLIERMMETFPGQGAWEPEGFCLGRPGSSAYFMGPCAAASAEAARRLICRVMAGAPAASFFWDLFPDQPAAVELARELGFEPRRTLVRMMLRPEPKLPGRPERVFAAAGFEYG
jgi:GNAT superfamily N-acetyltransferase